MSMDSNTANDAANARVNEDNDAMRTAAASLRMRTPEGRAAFVEGVEHGFATALRRARNGASLDQVEEDGSALIKLVREALAFVGPSGR